MAKHYSVKSMVTRVMPSKNGGFEDVIEVRFTTAQGANGAISFPKTQFDKLDHEAALKFVADRLSAEALKLDAILGL